MHEQAADVRLPLEGPLFALLEDWRRSQAKIPSRTAAIRQLLQQALERSSEKPGAAVAERDGAADSVVVCHGRRKRRGLPAIATIPEEKDPSDRQRGSGNRR
jgi:hypothetical protein